mgnify:CR=1 FL=1
MLDKSNAMYGDTMAEGIVLKQQARYMSEVTEYGIHFQSLGNCTWIFYI